MFLPNIKNNTQRCGKGIKKNKRRKNVDLHFMFKMKGTGETLKVDAQNTL